MGRRVGGVRAESIARLVTAVYALATVSTFFLRLVVRHPAARPSAVELLFGLLNIPVAHTLVSLVLLALITWALLTRKRIGWAAAAVCQLVGIGLGVLALVTLFVGPNGWPARRVFTRSLDVASIVVGFGALLLLWQARSVFRGSVRRGSWVRFTLALIVGAAVTVVTTWLVLGLLSPSPIGSRVHELAAVVALGLGDVDAAGRLRFVVPEWVADLVEVLAAATMIIALVLFLRSARDPGAWSGRTELRLRRLLAEHGEADSLGYFATRRDKSTVFGPGGHAAVTFRVLNGVALASGDPIGDRAGWPDAIAAWLARVRHYGWQPAVLAASEAGARAYVAAGFNVLTLGDEAIMDAERFNLSSTTMTPVRHAVQRATAAGVRVEVHRQQDLPPTQVAALAGLADRWRRGGTERGFSMALGRSGDPADARNLWVVARADDGTPVGLLSFVPWGHHGVSLDLMRRSPEAPNGVTELMVAQLMTLAPQHGIRQVSLNFCTLRSVYAAGDRFGATTVTRLNTSLLSLFDRFWQLERLYRATQRYHPAWSPRFLCYDDRVALPWVAWAAASAEGFLPHWPTRASHQQRQLTADERALAIEIGLRQPVDTSLLGPRRSDQTAVRIARLDELRDAGRQPYPLGLSAPELTVAQVTDAVWLDGLPVRVTGRVRALRDHGRVVFVDLVHDGCSLQALIEDRDGRDRPAELARLVDVGDLLVIDAVPGTSRRGTPSLIISEWAMAAKSLHPIPFGSLTDTEYRRRHRSTDLIVHPRQALYLRARSRLVQALRAGLVDEGYLEVETPILNTTHGGATARPFRTFINAYSADLTLRIAPELQLKRMLVGGLGPLFEIGRNFRNEGADASHNPEFTSLEAYQPWGDYHTMRELTERLVIAAARAVHGRAALPAATGPGWVDVGHPWPVVPVLEAVSDAVGEEVSMSTDLDVLIDHAARQNVDLHEGMGRGAIIEALYGDLVEPTTRTPTFYIDFPAETSPLTAPHRSRRGLAERWDLVINGMEIATAYSELTDPIEQRDRLTEQSLKAAAGDPEAMEVDEEFLFALETGMPPSGGLGLGVDRLAMVVLGAQMRDVLSFPFVRPDPDR